MSFCSAIGCGRRVAYRGRVRSDGLTPGPVAARLDHAVERRSDDLTADAFAFTYEGYEPDEEGVREVLTSSGNGRFCSRGAAEWEDAGGAYYPGTYAHGVYNRET